MDLEIDSYCYPTNNRQPTTYGITSYLILHRITSYLILQHGDEDFLCAIEANDPHISFVSIRAADTVAVSYEQFDRFGHALANHTNTGLVELQVPKPVDNVDLAGWFHFLGVSSRNQSITYFHYASDCTAERPLHVNSAMILCHFFERNDAL